MTVTPVSTTQTTVRPAENSMEAMTSVFSVLAQSNAPMKEELSKLASVFQNFMETTKSNIQTVVEENASLRKQLITAEANKKQADAAHQTERQAADKRIQSLMGQLETTNRTVTQLQSTCATLGSKVTDLTLQLGKLQTEQSQFASSTKESLTSQQTQCNTVNASLNSSMSYVYNNLGSTVSTLQSRCDKIDAKIDAEFTNHWKSHHSSGNSGVSSYSSSSRDHYYHPPHDHGN